MGTMATAGIMPNFYTETPFESEGETKLRRHCLHTASHLGAQFFVGSLFLCVFDLRARKRWWAAGHVAS